MERGIRFNRKQALALGLLVVMALVAVAVAATQGTDQLLRWVEDARAWVSWALEVVPPPLYLVAFCLVPAFGFPLSAFYLTAIPVLGGPYGAFGIAGAWFAILVNMALGYWIATGFVHPLAERLVRSRGYKIPRADPKHAWKLIVLVRLSPLPFAFQNLILGLAHVPFRPYLILSWLCQAPIGLAVVLVGDSLFSGGFKYAMAGLFGFVLLMFTLHLVRQRLQKSTADVSDPAT